MGAGISVILLWKLGRTVLAHSLVGWCRTNVGKMNAERRFFELSEGKSEDGGDGDDKNERVTCCAALSTLLHTSPHFSPESPFRRLARLGALLSTRQEAAIQ